MVAYHQKFLNIYCHCQSSGGSITYHNNRRNDTNSQKFPKKLKISFLFARIILDLLFFFDKVHLEMIFCLQE